MRMLIVTSALVFAGPVACVIDTIPMPEDTREGEDNGRGNEDPDTAGGGNFASSSAMYYASNPSLLVGVEDAVPANATVVVENAARQDWRGQSKASADGSFVMPINASVGDIVKLSVVQHGVTIGSLDITLEQPSADAVDAGMALSDAQEDDGEPVQGDGGVDAAPGNAEGEYIVSVPAGTLAPGINVVCANLDTGAATSTLTDGNGGFALSIAASSGDALVIFAVEAASSQSAAAAISITVP